MIKKKRKNKTYLTVVQSIDVVFESNGIEFESPGECGCNDDCGVFGNDSNDIADRLCGQRTSGLMI